MAKDRSRPRDESAGYDSIAQAVRETERGRWFLEEHARRSRSADLHLLFDAVERLQRIAGGESNPSHDALRADLAAVAALVVEARQRASALDGERFGGRTAQEHLAAAERRLSGLAAALHDLGGPAELTDELAIHAATAAAAGELLGEQTTIIDALGDALDRIGHRLFDCIDALDPPAREHVRHGAKPHRS